MKTVAVFDIRTSHVFSVHIYDFFLYSYVRSHWDRTQDPEESLYWSIRVIAENL